MPEDLHNKMKRHTEIRWSDVVRKTISQKIEDLDMLDKLTKKSRLTQKDVNEIAQRIDSSVAKKLGFK
ncbi:hypothetical protein GF323_01110 [Candidatus Woesearchaeota archaeon]|nr:hypothetical protein [Candidatus Woesearchaeota archaeon]